VYEIRKIKIGYMQMDVSLASTEVGRYLGVQGLVHNPVGTPFKLHSELNTGMIHYNITPTTLQITCRRAVMASGYTCYGGERCTA